MDKAFEQRFAFFLSGTSSLCSCSNKHFFSFVPINPKKSRYGFSRSQRSWQEKTINLWLLRETSGDCVAGDLVFCDKHK
jgi:hypothetical protein